MMDASDFLRLFDYDAWANRECISAMRTAGQALTGDTLGRFAHILSAQQLWLQRIVGQAQTEPVWPALSLDECGERVNEAAEAWRDFLSQPAVLDGSRTPLPTLRDTIVYRNTKGESFSNVVADILMHVLFHSAYHRGQLALQLRSSGCTPAYTDFIQAVRGGFIE